MNAVRTIGAKPGIYRPALVGLTVQASVTACTGRNQSTLDPAAPQAEAIATIGWLMFGGAAVILLVVTLLTAWAVWGPRDLRTGLANVRLVVGGGLVLPIVVLSVLLVHGLTLYDEDAAQGASGAGDPVRIEVVGERWWWRVRYLDAEGGIIATTANELRLPVGRPVELRLNSADVIHSFWLPNLAGKRDMIPGHTNILRLTPSRAGTFRGQCAEFCGGPHAQMAFYAVVEPPDRFAAWLALQAAPARPPDTPFLERGRLLFQSAGCGACHTIRGTPAASDFGPDLTHVGGRVSLGAGILPNNVGTLAGWIADPRHIKPQVLMPGFTIFTGPDLRAIAAYLESLK